jgi:hypothetical protein
MYHGKLISRLSDFDKSKPNYMVMHEYTKSQMGADYGPPDPPPVMETKTYIGMIGFSTREEVASWIKQNAEATYKVSAFRIFAIEEMSFKTDITISFGV